MFVFNRNILTITRHTKYLYKSFIVLNKLQQRVSKQLTKDYSLNNTSVLNTVELQSTVGTADVQEQNKSDQAYSINYDAITKGNKELEHKLKVIMLEAEVLRQEGHQIPPDDFIKLDMWDSLLNLPSRSARKKYLEFLFKNSKKKESRMLKKLENRKIFEEVKIANPPEGQKSLPIEEHALQYGLKGNNIFLRFHDTTVTRFYNSRLVQAMQFGQKIVIDCGYDQNMTRRENFNCAKQLMLLFAANRYSDQPFDIHFTNMNKESDLIKMLYKYIPTMYDPEFPMNTHEESYLDLFPKERLVYLTPHCREEMDSYDYDAVYIIGGIVDKINNEPLSLAKAKREGIKMMKFPVDRHLQWGAGSGKSLTLNQCTAILLDLKETGDWNHALRHVPKRKLADPSVNQSFDRTTRDRRFDYRRERSWKPSTYEKPSIIKNMYNDDRF